MSGIRLVLETFEATRTPQYRIDTGLLDVMAHPEVNTLENLPYDAKPVQFDDDAVLQQYAFDNDEKLARVQSATEALAIIRGQAAIPPLEEPHPGGAGIAAAIPFALGGYALYRWFQRKRA